MERPKIKLSRCLTALFLAGCQAENANVNVEITAKTPDNAPVPGASVTLDGEQIGQTNAFGTFSSQLSVSSKVRHKITISKEGSSHYYAPHFETFKFAGGEDRHLKIQPILYVVPKPRAKVSDLKDAQHDASLQPKKSDDIQIARSNTSFHLTSQDGSRVPLILLSAGDVVQTNQANQASNVQNLKQSIFTAHIYAGRGPLGSADVTFFSTDGTEHSCSTNDRGRCVITLPNSQHTAGSLLVRHEGFKSLLKEVIPTDNGNVRLSMEPGLNITIKSVEASPWHSKALPGAEIRLRGATVGVTNSQGLAVIIPENIIPITLRIDSPLHDDTQDISVAKASDANVLVRFSDHSQRGWNQWRILPFHLKGDVAESILTTKFQAALDQLRQDPQAEIETKDVQQFSAFPTGTISLIPIIEQIDGHYNFSLYAADSNGILAASSPVLIKSPQLAETWATAGIDAKKSLLAKLPWPGTIRSITRDIALISMETKYIHKDDQITIESENGPKTAKVTLVARDHIAAKIINNDEKKSQNAELVGRVAKKITPTDIKFPAQPTWAAMLKPLIIEGPEIQLAKKYLAENDKNSALKALSNIPDTEPNFILAAQMKATIFESAGDHTATAQELHRILRLTISKGLTYAATVAETNLMRLQIESLPVIPGDLQLIKRIEDIAQRAPAVKKEIQSNFPGNPNLPDIITTLDYTRLVATRKKAECEGDEVTLATLGSEWDDLERSLQISKEQKFDRSIWSHTISSERAKVSLVPVSDKKSM